MSFCAKPMRVISSHKSKNTRYNVYGEENTRHSFFLTLLLRRVILTCKLVLITYVSVTLIMCSTSELSSCDEKEKAKTSNRVCCKEPGCSASFSKNSKLINHTRKHKGERPFACTDEDCNKTYTNASHLRRHISTSHLGDKILEKNNVKCNVEGCGKTFINNFGLKRHKYRLHNALRLYPFTCAECKQGFSKKNQLRKHSYLHTGVLPFTCEICNTGFTTNRDCNRHKRSHTVYTCACGETFERWSNLLVHTKKCSKPEYKCKICLQVFGTPWTLKYHEQIHLDEEDRNVFACNIEGCDRFYFYKRNLINHVKTYHKNIKMKIPCPIEGCSSSLSKMQNVQVHIEKVHNKEVKEPKQRKIRKDAGKPKGSCVARLTRLNLPPSINSKIAQNMSIDVDKLQNDLLSSNNLRAQLDEPKNIIVPFNEDLIKKKLDNQLLIEDCLLRTQYEEESNKTNKQTTTNDKLYLSDANNIDKKVEVINNDQMIICEDVIKEANNQDVREIFTPNADSPSSENSVVAAVVENNNLNHQNEIKHCALCLDVNLNTMDADLEYSIDTYNDIECIKSRLQNFAKKETVPKIIKILVNADSSSYYFCTCSFKILNYDYSL